MSLSFPFKKSAKQLFLGFMCLMLTCNLFKPLLVSFKIVEGLALMCGSIECSSIFHFQD